jgi:hypothetical protein
LPAINIADIENIKAGMRIMSASSGYRKSILTQASIRAFADSGKAPAIDLA